MQEIRLKFLGCIFSTFITSSEPLEAPSYTPFLNSPASLFIMRASSLARGDCFQHNSLLSSGLPSPSHKTELFTPSHGIPLFWETFLCPTMVWALSPQEAFLLPHWWAGRLFSSTLTALEMRQRLLPWVVFIVSCSGRMCALFFFQIIRKSSLRKLEVVGVSQLGCVGSGNKLQRQKKSPWSLGGRRVKGKARMCSQRGELAQSVCPFRAEPMCLLLCIPHCTCVSAQLTTERSRSSWLVWTKVRIALPLACATKWVTIEPNAFPLKVNMNLLRLFNTDEDHTVFGMGNEVLNYVMLFDYNKCKKNVYEKVS